MTHGRAADMSQGTPFAHMLEAIRRINHAPDGVLPLHAPVFAGHEREYVLDTIDSTFVSSVGAYVDRFESMLCELTGAKCAVACANGTVALQVALTLAGVQPKDMVITQALSFVATANAIHHAGADPIFVDIERDTLGLSPEAVQVFLQTHCERVSVDGGTACRHRATGRRVAACVPMHSFGLPCRMDALLPLCADWGIAVVEDAAEALGSTRNGQHCGTFGLLGTLSFNGNKIVTTGGGGAILTNNVQLGTQAKHVTTTAKIPHRWEFRHDAVAWNFRMPNLNAALGCAQLERLPEFVIEKRRRSAAYATVLATTPWEFVVEPAQTQANYWLCAMLLRDRTERDAFLAASNDAGITTRPVWEPLYSLPIYHDCVCGDFLDTRSATAAMADRLVNLPSGVRE